MSDSKRYALHSKAKKEGYRVVSKAKTIFVGHSKRNNLSNTVITLRELYGYAIQVEIE
jgi:hypothetical protein